MGVGTKSPPAASQAPAQAGPAGSACLADNLGWLLAQAHFGLASEMTAALADLDISPRGYCVLKTAMTGQHTQIELAEAVGVDKTTMVVTLDELEAAGLADRRPAEHDRRARVISVTPVGKRKVAAATKVTERVQAEVLAALPARQRDAMLDGLKRLVTGSLAETAPCGPSVRRREPRA